MKLWINFLVFGFTLVWLSACNSGTNISDNDPVDAPLVSAYSADKIQNRVLLGAYIDGDGWDATAIDSFNNKLSKPVSIINVFSNFDMDWEYLKYQSSNIVSLHAIPMISWMPSSTHRPDDSLLTEIANGEWDNYLDEWVNGFRLWLATYQADQKPTIMIRFAHEFNSDWFSWSNQPIELISAWRHVHQRFIQAGVSEYVEWVWNVNNVDVDDYNDFSVYYPGDDVVDWVSVDGYNWGSNYHYSHWKSFDETFSAAYVKLVTDFPDKPVMIAEVASTEPADLPRASMGQLGDNSDQYEDKSFWVIDMLISLERNYPAIKAVLWFNSNKELSWALDADKNTGLNAYNIGSESDHFVTLDQLLAESVSSPLAKTSLPKVVGTELLKQEAEALKAMSRKQRIEIRRAQLPGTGI